MGRWLGPAPNIGDEMAMYILKENGQVVIRTTLRHLTEEKNNSEVETNNKIHFDFFIQSKLGDAICDEDLPEHITLTYKPYQDDKSNLEPSAEEVDNIPDYDKYIVSKILIPTESEYLKTTTVTERVKDVTGKPKGNYSPNPHVDSREYKVMFDDGTVKEYSANVIAENLITVSGDESYSNHFLNEIVDHRKDGKSISKDDGMVTRNGRSIQRKTNKGWFLCVKW